MQRTPRRLLLMLAALAVFILPVAVFAAGGFTDVDDDSNFKADIDWLADAGVTKGCNPPDNTEFCPKDNVTREQMAAFMHRLAANKVVDAKTAVTAGDSDKLDGKDSTAFAASGHDHDAAYLAKTGKAADSDKLDGFSVESIVPRAVGTNYNRAFGQEAAFEATVTINAPARGVIIAHAGGDSWLGTGPQYCVLYLDVTTFMGSTGYVDHAQDSEADCITSASVVVDAGVHTVDLQLGGDGAVLNGEMWAMWIPFDGTGEVPAAATLGSIELDEKYQE